MSADLDIFTAALRDVAQGPEPFTDPVVESTRRRVMASLGERRTTHRRRLTFAVFALALSTATLSWAASTGRLTTVLQKLHITETPGNKPAEGPASPTRASRSHVSVAAPPVAAPPVAAPPVAAPPVAAPAVAVVALAPIAAPPAPVGVGPVPVSPSPSPVGPNPLPVSPSPVGTNPLPVSPSPSPVGTNPLPVSPSEVRSTESRGHAPRAPRTRTRVAALTPTAEAAEEIAPAPAPAPLPAPDPDTTAYRHAHGLHFHGADPSAALAAWDAYLAAYPHGRFATEAAYNRAITLVRLGRKTDARAALAPFADGTVGGGYRQAEARKLREALVP